jgi:hypothetical protein
MHHVTRSLAVALAGTAAAAVIINRPDELGDNVVTGRAIALNAIESSDVAQVLKVERFDFHALLT